MGVKTHKNPTRPAPLQWPQQSPIELYEHRSIHVPSLPAFKSEYRGAYPGKFEGPVGHRNFVLIRPYPGHVPTIELGDVKARLIKIHLHTPPEHDFEGNNEGGELHLIHEIVDPTEGSTLLVVAVFFRAHASERTAEPVKSFLDVWADGCAGKDDVVEIHPHNLLPDTRRWYRYEGSLTSEPYEELVSWLVFTEPLLVGSDDLEKLRAQAAQPERLPQPTSRRFVLRNFERLR